MYIHTYIREAFQMPDLSGAFGPHQWEQSGDRLRGR